MTTKSDLSDMATAIEQSLVDAGIQAAKDAMSENKLTSTGRCRLETCDEELDKPGQLFCDHRCAEIYEKQKKLF